jgi:hypothetical protein
MADLILGQESSRAAPACEAFRRATQWQKLYHDLQIYLPIALVAEADWNNHHYD